MGLFIILAPGQIRKTSTNLLTKFIFKAWCVSQNSHFPFQRPAMGSQSILYVTSKIQNYLIQFFCKKNMEKHTKTRHTDFVTTWEQSHRPWPNFSRYSVVIWIVALKDVPFRCICSPYLWFLTFFFGIVKIAYFIHSFLINISTFLSQNCASKKPTNA